MHQLRAILCLLNILFANKCNEDQSVTHEGTNGEELEVAYLLITVYLQVTSFYLKIKRNYTNLIWVSGK
jgi:hypothetical protein